MNPSNNQPASLEDLVSLAKNLRKTILHTIHRAQSGHPGGSFSELEILITLYHRIMRHKPTDPSWGERDRFILSKGHASPGLYAILAEQGYFEEKELLNFRQIDSLLQGHTSTITPGVEMSAGSLGQGLSFSVAVAIAGKIDKAPYRVYVLLGDGECDEGQIWEAAMSASHYRLDNLTAIVDRNRIQNDRFTDQVMTLEPLQDKWEAFGWHVIQADGHSIEELTTVFEKAKTIKGKPTVLIANTVKGKGVSFMENNPAFHGKAPNDEQLAQALDELST